MQKIDTLTKLANIADQLDASGFTKEANSVTDVMQKITQESRFPGLFTTPSASTPAKATTPSASTPSGADYYLQGRKDLIQLAGEVGGSLMQLINYFEQDKNQVLERVPGARELYSATQKFWIALKDIKGGVMALETGATKGGPLADISRIQR